MKTLSLAIVVLALALAGCAPAGPAPLSEMDRQKITEHVTAYGQAMQSADWDALVMHYTADGTLLPPNADAVTGRDGIKSFMSNFPPVTRASVEVIAIEGAGDMAVVYGKYSLTIAPPGMPTIEDYGKFIEYRKRQADGSWPIVWDIFNTSVPQPAGM